MLNIMQWRHYSITDTLDLYLFGIKPSLFLAYHSTVNDFNPCENTYVMYFLNKINYGNIW